MATLNSLFNRATLGTKCKTCLNLAISRIKLLRNKREVQLKQMSKEISQYLRTGQEAIARIRVEHVIREQNIMAAYEIIELFCEFVLARVPILESQRDCPTELHEAISSIIFAAPRCSDLPELVHLRNLFNTKYGKEFVTAASELQPGSNVNRTVIEKLTVRAPSAELKVKVLKAIAREFSIEWDSSSTEEELSKKHEDLLDGSSSLSLQAPVMNSSSPISTRNENSLSPIKENKREQSSQIPINLRNNHSSVMNEIAAAETKKMESTSLTEEPSSYERTGTSRNSSDVMEKARAAIALAERASAAARAAAELVNVKLPIQASTVGESN